MPHHSISLIRALIGMSLAKAELTWSAKDLAELALRVNDHYNEANSPRPGRELRISDHYFDDLRKNMEAAEQEGKNTLSARDQNLIAACNYIDYPHLRNFSKSWKLIEAQLPNQASPSDSIIRLFHHPDDLEGFISPRLEEAFPSDVTVNIALNDYSSDLDALFDALNHCINARQLAVLNLPFDGTSAELQTRLKSFFQTLDSTCACLITLWPEAEKATELQPLKNPKDAVFAHMDFQLALHAAYWYLRAAQPESDATPPSAKGRGQIHIQDSGTVVLGNMRVSGTNVSQGDMHITNNNYNPDSSN